MDIVDWMLRMMCSRCATRRWPIAVWQNLFDIVALNVWIVCKEATKQNVSRKDFSWHRLVDCLTRKGSKTWQAFAIHPRVITKAKKTSCRLLQESIKWHMSVLPPTSFWESLCRFCAETDPELMPELQCSWLLVVPFLKVLYSLICISDTYPRFQSFGCYLLKIANRKIISFVCWHITNLAWQ